MAVFESHIGLHDELPVFYHCDTIYPGPRVANWHDNIEILYTIDGEGEILCGARYYPAVRGDVFLVNTNEIHAVRANAPHIKQICLIIDNEFCKRNGIPVHRLDFLHPIRDKAASELCDKLFAELSCKDEYRRAGASAALLNLMLYLWRNHSRPTAEQESTTDTGESMRIAIGYIKSHFNEKLTLEDIAFEAGLSKFYFSREFKKLTGVTVVTYINMLRCREARKMLEQDKYSIHQVSEYCGFSNDSYFTKTYKKYIGSLPSKSEKGQNSVN